MALKILARYDTAGHSYVRLRLSDGSVVAEHRFVMEQYLGRPLRGDEEVHHKDENKKNNALENLELLTASEHTKHHHPERLETLVCPFCEQSFQRHPRYVRSKRSLGAMDLYCSASCSASARATRTRNERGSVIAHGTSSGYNIHGCRCDACRSYKAARYTARK